MEKKFKLALDIHGVIDALPETFSFLARAIIAAGGEIHLVTGGIWNTKLEEQLKSYGMVWTHQFSVYDHLIKTNVKTLGEIVFPDGTVQKKFEDGFWDKAKGDYCREHQIDLHLDDTLIYNDFFTTPFARIWTHNQKPKASHKDIRHLN